MRCPKCGAKTKVIETRGNFRRRRCSNPTCAHSFETREDPTSKLEYHRVRAISRLLAA
jgi:transcriptional regulator NrdR family protein